MGGDGGRSELPEDWVGGWGGVIGGKGERPEETEVVLLEGVWEAGGSTS